MNKYYILIIEESIKAFSLMGHGNVCEFTFSAKSQTTPFKFLEDNSQIIGYISNNEKRFAYIFSANKASNDTECHLTKLFESIYGPTIDKLSDKVKSIIYKNESTQSLIQIDKDTYEEIFSMMIQSCTEKFLGSIDSRKDITEENSIHQNTASLTKGNNILYYGIPGSGKSHAISKICTNEEYTERVVFYPDYSHSDFIGQIVPRLNQNKNLEYVFAPGPFTKILKKSYDDPDNMYYLVIEEINRGNAAAIFGEVFQLLDRDDSGTSEYSINNYDIAESVYQDASHPVKIPHNLTLLATMNTADQNVFTLDTAFQRRWTMKHLANNFNDQHSDDIIEGTQITWGAFAQTINELILQNNSELIGSGDKRLGVFFAKKDELKPTTFSEKVLKYLWDDAFKLDREVVFNEKYKSIEELIEDYENEENDKLATVSNPSIYQKMLNASINKG